MNLEEWNTSFASVILWSPVPVNRLCILYPTLLIELKRWVVSSSTSNIMSLWWCWPQRTKWRSSPPAIKLVDSWALFLLWLGCRLAASIIWRLSWATVLCPQRKPTRLLHTVRRGTPPFFMRLSTPLLWLTGAVEEVLIKAPVDASTTTTTLVICEKAASVVLLLASLEKSESYWDGRR